MNKEKNSNKYMFADRERKKQCIHKNHTQRRFRRRKMCKYLRSHNDFHIPHKWQYLIRFSTKAKISWFDMSTFQLKNTAKTTHQISSYSKQIKIKNDEHDRMKWDWLMSNVKLKLRKWRYFNRIIFAKSSYWMLTNEKVVYLPSVNDYVRVFFFAIDRIIDTNDG